MNSRRTRKSMCKRNNLRGGGSQYYSFGPDVTGAGVGASAVLRHDYGAVARYGMASGGTGAGLPGMRGGRYIMDPSPLAPESGVAGGVISPIACEGTRSTWPGKGGAAPVDSISMNPALREQTAGYAQGVDTSVATGGAGVPIQIQVPYDARSMNPMCKGGARRRRGRTQRKRRAATRARKSQRRRRAASRKSSARK